MKSQGRNISHSYRSDQTSSGTSESDCVTGQNFTRGSDFGDATFSTAWSCRR